MQFCVNPATLVLLSLMPLTVYVAAAYISRQVPGMLCIQKNTKTVSCRDLVTDDMADCIVQLRCMTGCDANSGFYGKDKKSQYDRVS